MSSEKIMDERDIFNFYKEMLKKAEVSRKKGRTVWRSCSAQELSDQLHQHIEKGDPLDIALYCMMLKMRKESFGILPETKASKIRRFRESWDKTILSRQTLIVGDDPKDNHILAKFPAIPKFLDLRMLQTKLPWTIKYSSDFRSNPMAHKDFSHALVHVSKATGKLSEFVDNMDHDKDDALASITNKKTYSKYIADLVVCALRLANTFPGGPVDLHDEVVNRIETKNEVAL